MCREGCSFSKPYVCARGCMCERENGAVWSMFLAEADSNYVSVWMLLKVLLPVKVKKFEKIDKSPVITRNYFYA